MSQQATTVSAAQKVTLSSQKTLHKGDRGSAVRELQNALNAHGASLSVDGIFGPRTDRAVERFQGNKGLTVDGIVDPQTRAALNGTENARPSAAKTSNRSSSSGVLDTARSQIGTGYTWGGDSPGEGFDCSGFVH